MTYLIIIGMCLLISALVVRFFKYVSRILLILFSLAIIFLLIMPLNLEVGVKGATYCAVMFMIVGLLSLVSGVVSAVVVSPFLLLWASIKTLFKD